MRSIVTGARWCQLCVVTVAVALAACGLDTLGSREVGGDVPDRPPPDGAVDASQDAADGGAGDARTSCGSATCAIALSADHTHTCATIRDEKPRCWGGNAAGQLGFGLLADGSEDLGSSTRPRAAATSGPMHVSIGGFVNTSHPFSCAVAATGEVMCWGSDDFGQLGRVNARPPPGTTSVPAAVEGISDAVDISAGGSHSCALLTAGRVTCWGFAAYGQLGRNGGSFDPAVVGTVPLRAAAKHVSSGDFHTCAVLADETIDCWGLNNVGQLGRVEAYGASTSTPGPAAGVAGALGVMAGYAHTCAVLRGGSVLCWGYNAYGQLGRGSAGVASVSPSPALLPAGRRAVSACAGFLHSCAVLTDGAVMCWGLNDLGQLGTGTVSGTTVTPGLSATPLVVQDVTGASAVVCGGRHTCATIADGQAVCWGANDMGQLGTGAPPDTSPHPRAARVAF